MSKRAQHICKCFECLDLNPDGKLVHKKTKIAHEKKDANRHILNEQVEQINIISEYNE